ncbi:DUF4259 domain-containing protein [Galactobacter valiniphilus]|uniref:DUF4259 domain-containing protein n=1 Tax=Galactobacter valiniphilus TaxID=2676122 RepID=UPI003734DEF8
MGAWGHEPFENDTALDWVFELEEADSPEPLLLTLAAALDPGGVEDAHGGSEAVAAAAALARLGHAGTSVTGKLPDEVLEWVGRVKSPLRPEAAELAVRALEAVLNTEDSELAELWDEAEEPAWREHTAALRDWLRNAAALADAQ